MEGTLLWSGIFPPGKGVQRFYFRGTCLYLFFSPLYPPGIARQHFKIIFCWCFPRSAPKRGGCPLFNLKLWKEKKRKSWKEGEKIPSLLGSTRAGLLTDLCFLGGNSGSCPCSQHLEIGNRLKTGPWFTYVQHHVWEEFLRWRSLVHKKEPCSRDEAYIGVSNRSQAFYFDRIYNYM